MLLGQSILPTFPSLLTCTLPSIPWVIHILSTGRERAHGVCESEICVISPAKVEITRSHTHTHKPVNGGTTEGVGGRINEMMDGTPILMNPMGNELLDSLGVGTGTGSCLIFFLLTKRPFCCFSFSSSSVRVFAVLHFHHYSALLHIRFL